MDITQKLDLRYSKIGPHTPNSQQVISGYISRNTAVPLNCIKGLEVKNKKFTVNCDMKTHVRFDCRAYTASNKIFSDYMSKTCFFKK